MLLASFGWPFVTLRFAWASRSSDLNNFFGHSTQTVRLSMAPLWLGVKYSTGQNWARSWFVVNTRRVSGGMWPSEHRPRTSRAKATSTHALASSTLDSRKHASSRRMPWPGRTSIFFIWSCFDTKWTPPGQSCNKALTAISVFPVPGGPCNISAWLKLWVSIHCFTPGGSTNALKAYRGVVIKVEAPKVSGRNQACKIFCNSAPTSRMWPKWSHTRQLPSFFSSFAACIGMAAENWEGSRCAPQ